MWTNSSLATIHQLLLTVPTELQLAFVHKLALSVDHYYGGDGGDEAEREECTAAAVTCTQAALQVCSSQENTLHHEFLITLHNNTTDPLLMLFLGEAIGFDALLKGLGGGDAVAVAVEILFTFVVVDDGGDESKYKHASSIDHLITTCIVNGSNEDGAMLLLPVVQLLWEHDCVVAVGRLLCAALTLDSSSSASIATQFFKDISTDCSSMTSSNFVHVLGVVAPLLRRDSFLLSASGLSNVALHCCCCTTQNHEAAAVCFPTTPVAPPIPQWASSSPTPSTPLVVGAAVWYRHKDGSWEAAEVVTVDVSVDPLSYGVRLVTGIRETEGGRLKERKADEPPPLVAMPAAFVKTHHINNNYNTTTTELCATDEEKTALLDLFREVGSTSAVVLRSALSWCWKDFTESDWSLCFTALHQGMETAAQAAATAVATVAKELTVQASAVAGADLGGPEAALAFFRQLHHKGVLHSTVKGAAAAAALQTSISSALSELNTEHGTALSALLQTYCQSAQCVPLTRTCPFTLWESSQAAVCAATVDIFISLGKIHAQWCCCCSNTSASVSPLRGLGVFLGDLAGVVDATVAAADRSFLVAVVGRADARVTEEGVGCTEALVALVLQGGDSSTSTTTTTTTTTTTHSSSSSLSAVRDAAYRSIVLHPELITDLVRGGGSTGVDEEDADQEVALFTRNFDWREMLERAGVVPDLAAAAASAPHPSHVIAWGMLTAYLLYMPESSGVRVRLVECVKEAHGLVHGVADALLPLLPLNNTSNTVAVFGAEDTSGRGFAHRLCALGVPSTTSSSSSSTTPAHAALVYAGMLRALPVPCRLWFGDLRDKTTIAALEKYTATAVSAGLLAAEFSAVEEMAKGLDRFEKFSVRANASSREVIASLEIEDGHMLELVVKLPAVMPLRAPEADCRRSVEVSQVRLRKWLLSITAFLRNRNGAVAGALLLWKRNVDTEFAGHEECLICVSIIQPSTGQLPKLGCRTCRKKYHSSCLYKWFQSSGKSQCPHCQSPW